MTKDTERAYQKALCILERRDHTESELRRKLKDREFQQDEIDYVLERLVSYGLINDRRYAEQYIRYHGLENSKRVLAMKLLRKGIKSDLFESVYLEVADELGMNPEQEALEKAVLSALRKAERSGAVLTDLSREERDKIIASLFRKGFSVGKIKSELNKAVKSD